MKGILGRLGRFGATVPKLLALPREQFYEGWIKAASQRRRRPEELEDA